MKERGERGEEGANASEEEGTAREKGGVKEGGGSVFFIRDRAANERLGSVGKDTRKRPIVALSAYNDQENISYCLNSGMTQFIEKPARKDKLNRLLTDLGIVES